jgi:regulator of protease activity HflC (stomatin/prohibitin superfamily)
MASEVKKVVWDKPIKYALLGIFVLVILVITGFITVPQAGTAVVFALDLIWRFLKALGSIAKQTVHDWKATH